MRNWKLAILPMLVVVGLLTTGFAFAHWSKSLYIRGTVNTGELDWEFVYNSHAQKDPYDPPTNDWNSNVGMTSIWQTGKNVGWTDIGYVDTEPDGDYDALTVTLNNVYPSYYEHIAFKLHNNGTIPLHVENIVINPGAHWYTAQMQVPINLDLNNDGKADIELWYGDSFGTQLHPCGMVDISFDVHVLQDAPEGENLNFSIGIIAVQYNESIHPMPLLKPTIQLNPTSLTFNAVQGGSNPSSQNVTVKNIGPLGSTLYWSATDNAAWVSESPTSGSLGSGASENTTVSVNITGLTAGTYYATITVSDPNATNDPQTVSVTLVVTAPVSENVKLHPDNVLDNTSCSLYLLTALERGKLENSDNSRYTNKYYWGYSFDNSKYIEFRFPDIPAGATVNSVVLKFEWQRTWEVDNARLRIWDGSTWVIRYLTPLPNAGTDRTENIDLKDLYGINTAAKVNGLKIQFQATDGSGAGTSIDWVEVQVNYTP